jgi:hypothetical protein
MEENRGNQIIEFYLKEYETLKDEQRARIGFRDNLVYVTLVAIGGVLSYALTKGANLTVLLVLPMVCFVLGWTYLVNDEKVSAIGKYIRTTLFDRVRELTGEKDIHVFGWEVVHRSDKRRLRRKLMQLLVDEITFVGVGIAALGMFLKHAPTISVFLYTIILAEALLLAVLAFEIFAHADYKKGR